MELLNTKKFGGYDVHFLDTLSVNFECPVCRMAFREPIQTDCGHRLCLSCSEEIKIRNEGVLICPLDKSISDKTFSDKAYEREILQLKVKCGNFQNNCEWTGELKLLSNHLTNCDYQKVKCTNEECFTLLLRKELKNHMETHCIYRSVTCQYCYQKISYIELKIHFENCESFQLNCVNQCGARVLRKEMSSHITDDCTLTIISCQYINIGCNFKGMRKDQKAHANSSTQDHLSMAISKLVFLENKILTNENETTKKLSVLEKEMGKDQGECRKSSNEEMSTKLNALEDKINCLAKEVSQDQDEYRKLSKEEMSTKLNVLEDKFNCLAKKVGQGQDEYRKSSYEEMSSKLNALEDKINCLAKEVGQDQDEFRKSSKEEMSTKLNALEDKINCLAKKVGQDQDEYRKLSNEEMSTKLNALDKISCLAKEVEHLNKRAPEPRILKHAVWLNEPTDSSKLTRPVLEEEKCLGFREILKQTNERCRPK